MMRLVAAVIEDDVKGAEFLVHFIKEIRVGLTADSDVDILVGDFVRLT